MNQKGYKMTQNFNQISTHDLSGMLGNQGVQIIDIRPVDAYNGWRLLNEPRGGHIKGARSLPYKWTKYIDWIEMVRRKNIRPEDEIIIYGYRKEEIEIVANRFSKSDYNKVNIYLHFLDEWVTKDSLPMEDLVHHQHLVPAIWVKELISGDTTRHYPENKLVLIHAHYRNRLAYLSGHIPGAIDMDTLEVEDPKTWNRRSPEELRTAFERHGITADTTVVIYGKYLSPDNNDPFPGSAAGDIGAIRIAFIMLYAGIKDVRVLNGGFQSWIDEGFEVSHTDEPKIPVAEFGVSIPANPQLAVDTPEAKKMLVSSGAELVCVRSWPEYIGEVSGYHYIKPKGRIPGAIFADCGSDAYHMENYRNFDHTTRESNEIADIWVRSGITPDKHLAFYCGTGWRGSEAWFNAWLMGWPRISVYDGGWFEWSKDVQNPYETGIPEQYNNHIYQKQPL